MKRTDIYTENGEHLVQVSLEAGEPLSPESVSELQALKDRPIAYDEDCPEYSYEELLVMYEAAKKKRAEERKKQIVSLRISARSLNKAKSLGKGYTSVLSRLLEMALDDPEMVKKAL